MNTTRPVRSLLAPRSTDPTVERECHTWPDRSTVTVVNLLRRLLLGAGQMPDTLKAALVADGLVLLEQALAGSVTYRHYRAPGQYSSYRKVAITGAIGISTRRLIVWGARIKQIDMPVSLIAGSGMTIAETQPGRVSFSYDAGRFSPDRSGSVEVRLHTAQAGRIVALLNGTGPW